MIQKSVRNISVFDQNTLTLDQNATFWGTDTNERKKKNIQPKLEFHV